MKNIKDLRVKVTYEVGLGDLEMPKEAYNEIIEAGEKGKDIEMCSLEFSAAEEWLSQNIREQDCFEWKAEVIEMISGDSNEADA